MENYSAINPLLLSQSPSVETVKNLSQQKDANNDELSLKKASQDFESILVNFVINAMWKTIPKSGLFEENTGGLETYTEIMHTVLSQDIVAKGGIGVAPIIYKQLMHNKELTEKPITPPLSNNNNYTVNLTKEANEEQVHMKDETGKKGVNQS